MTTITSSAVKRIGTAVTKSQLAYIGDFAILDWEELYRMVLWKET
jgi:hypothetical protein